MTKIKLILTIVVAMAMFTGCSLFMSEPEPVPELEIDQDTVIEEQPTEQPTPPASSMGTVRNFFNLDGLRFAYHSDVTEENASNFVKGDMLGELTKSANEWTEDQYTENLYSNLDKGAKLYAIDGYDNTYRIIVEQGDKLSIYQSVANSDDSNLDLANYFTAADFSNNVEQIDIYDHMGINSLKSLDAATAKDLLDKIALSQPAQLQDADYQNIASAQSDGKSFLLKAKLSDGTSTDMYVIPQLNIVMVGDGKYTIDQTLAGEISDIFTGLEQSAPPMSGEVKG